MPRLREVPHRWWRATEIPADPAERLRVVAKQLLVMVAITLAVGDYDTHAWPIFLGGAVVLGALSSYFAAAGASEGTRVDDESHG